MPGFLSTVQLPVGQAEVRIEGEGLRTAQERVEISPGNISFSYALEEIDIVPVRISTNLAGTSVHIDGTARGETDESGLLGFFLYPGEYSIELQRSGYLTLSGSVTISEVAENRFDYTLQRNVGRLRLQLTPRDARVELNRQDFTGESMIELAPGRYRLDVSRSGYESHSESIEIELDQDQSRSVRLTRYTGSLQFTVVPGNAQVRLLGSGGELVQSWEGVHLAREIPTGSYTLQVSASGWQNQERQVVIEQGQRLQLDIELERGFECGDPVTFTYAGEQVTYGAVFSADNRCWLDRNLGASRAATSSTDSQSYGDLFQWGRAADGHQSRNSGTTSTLSSSDQPGHGSFILATDSPWDWRTPQNNNLWQGVNGIKNPCPIGYRLPTDAEWEAERGSWSSNNAAGAFNSPLKLPVAGSRSLNSGSVDLVGSYSYYWSGTVSGTLARDLFFSSSYAYMLSFNRAFGFSVRCLKN